MLNDCIPSFFAKTEQTAELFHTEQPELDAAELEVESWLKELHIFTAEKSIAVWEKDFVLTPDPDMSLEQRRARVFSKKTARMVPKKAVLENTLKEVFEAERVSISELACTLDFMVQNGNIADNLPAAIGYLKQIKPAHFGLRASPKYIHTSKTYIGHAVKRYKKMHVTAYQPTDPLENLVWYTDENDLLLLTEEGDVLVE